MTNDTDKICSICHEGILQPQVDKGPVEYKGQTTEMELHYYICNACGCELGTGEQMDINAKQMTLFRKKVDGLMPGAEIRAIRERLGLSHEEASRVFKGEPTPFSEFENDEAVHSAETEKLLRQAAEHPDTFMQARDKLIVPPSGSHVRPKESASPALMPG